MDRTGVNGDRHVVFVGTDSQRSRAPATVPRWSRLLGYPLDVRPVDVAPGAGSDVYRGIVDELAADPQAAGAVITAHKVAMYTAVADRCAYVSPDATRLEECNVLAARPSGMAAHATDVSSVGAEVDRIWPPTSAPVVCFGAGGSAAALCLHLLSRQSPPQRIMVCERDHDRAAAFARLFPPETLPDGVALCLEAGDATWDKTLVSLPAGALVINATGLGKTDQQSPLSSDAVFPEGATIWDLNLPRAAPVPRQRSRPVCPARAPHLRRLATFHRGVARCPHGPARHRDGRWDRRPVRRHRTGGREMTLSTTPAVASDTAEQAEPSLAGRTEFSVAEAIALRCRQHGIRKAFAYPGTSELALCHAFSALSDGTLVNARGDSESAFMAGASGLAGKPEAVAIVHAARGLTNAAGAVADLRRNELPALVIVGLPSTRSAEFLPPHGEDGLVDAVGTFAKASLELAWPSGSETVDPVGAVDTALDQATALPGGPVLLGVPQDILEARAVPTGATEPLYPTCGCPTARWASTPQSPTAAQQSSPAGDSDRRLPVAPPGCRSGPHRVCGSRRCRDLPGPLPTRPDAVPATH